MIKHTINTDVLCIGHASYDLIFSVDKHPKSDEKIFAESLISCGGGPAANAAVTVSRLGLSAAFSGYLGNDLYGNMHQQEFQQDEVITDLIVRGNNATPLSTILVKPDGKRALINYKGDTKALSNNAIDFSWVKTKTILFDGHEPNISLDLINSGHHAKTPMILDAGSFHQGTESLMDKVEYLVASEKFAIQYAGDVESALTKLAKIAPNVVITMGEHGVLWNRKNTSGALSAFPTNGIDSTGAGDAFHGAFAAAVSLNLDWLDILRYASAAGSLCCERIGARKGLPTREQHNQLYQSKIKL